MIAPGANARVYLACGVTDMRKGITGLAAKAQEELRQNAASGALFAFRGRRGDRIKLLHWDGQGFCLYYKVLEKGRFPWPSPADGSARLTAAQLAMLWEGIDSAPVPRGARRLHALYDFLGCSPLQRWAPALRVAGIFSQWNGHLKLFLTTRRRRRR